MTSAEFRMLPSDGMIQEKRKIPREDEVLRNANQEIEIELSKQWMNFQFVDWIFMLLTENSTIRDWIFDDVTEFSFSIMNFSEALDISDFMGWLLVFELIFAFLVDNIAIWMIDLFKNVDYEKTIEILLKLLFIKTKFKRVIHSRKK